MRLQSILLPDKNICDVEEMYFHRDGDTILFDGYFNLFYLEKHHKYCDIDTLTLEIEIKGFRNLYVMHDTQEVHKEVLESRPISGRDRLIAFRENRQIIEKDATSLVQRLSIKLPYGLCKKGVLWFKAEVDPRFAKSSEKGKEREESWYIKGYYEGKKEQKDITPGSTDNVSASDCQVELAVNICTFKREPYVLRNMMSLVNWLERERSLEGDVLEISKHMHVFIVDNGQTLSDNDDFQKLLLRANGGSNKKLIEVFPNANTGGTGGFSRGMREAIARKEDLSLTHLLMMDDDAVFDPDLFVRLYGFLSMLRPEYREITVGGALLREDYRYVQHAAGEWFTNYKVINEHPLEDMRSFENCTAEFMTGTDKEHQMYGAWWCCCYHMSAITNENIPLPIFVHHDDIQFGMKQTKKGIVYLNGICVWHQGFELVFPGVKQYYNMRNTLITMKMFEPKVLKKSIKYWTIRRYIGMLISYRYADCEFIIRGLRDYLRGERWLLESDPEAIHKELMETYRQLCGMKKVDELGLSEEELVSVIRQIDKIGCISADEDNAQNTKLSVDGLRSYYSHERFNGPLSKKITFNGWFFPHKEGIKVITPLDSPWDTYRYDKIVLYEPGSGKGAVMRRSNKEFFKGIGRILNICVMSIKDW